MPQGCGERRAPAQISLREAAHTLYRQVWWGSPKVALRERDHDETFVADEQALAVLPIVSPLSRPGEVAEGLVRIGLCTAGGSPADDAVELLSIDVLYEGMLSLLQSAAQRA